MSVHRKPGGLTTDWNETCRIVATQTEFIQCCRLRAPGTGRQEVVAERAARDHCCSLMALDQVADISTLAASREPQPAEEKQASRSDSRARGPVRARSSPPTRRSASYRVSTLANRLSFESRRRRGPSQRASALRLADLSVTEQCRS